MISSSPIRFCSSNQSTWHKLATRLWWVSITPLGRPVVPLEYGKTTRSFFGSMATTGAGSSVDNNSEKELAPSASPKTNTSSTEELPAASRALSRKGGTVTRNLALESLSCLASSAAVYSGLTVVLIPPTEATALNTSAYSGILGQ